MIESTNNEILEKRQKMMEELNKPVPLKYNTYDNYNSYSNILFIDSQVTNYNDFYTNCNPSTFPIIYSFNSESSELNTILTNFTNIAKIGFVFDELHLNNKGFIERLPFFNDNDLTVENINDLSSNFKLLVELCIKLGVKNIDFLACNSLNYPKWVKYYGLLNTFTKTELNQLGVIVGASNDKTGNVKYGGDWVMESTGSNIEFIYFTEGITSYSNTLSLSITPSTNTTIYIQQDGNDIQYQVGATISGNWTIIDSWPAVFTNSSPSSLSLLTVQLYTDITISTSTTGTSSGTDVYFVAGSEYITFDGNNNTINIISILGYKGLIQNGTSYDSNGYNNITVHNIRLTADNNSLLDYYNVTHRTGSGWICQYYFGRSKTNCIVSNCSSNAIINTITNGFYGFCGGIIGGYCEAAVINCYSIGPISGQYSGGIFGYYASTGQNYLAIATNCYSTGEISGNYAGGIFGSNALTATATNCYSTGRISGSNAGGIFGGYGGFLSGSNANAINCYTTGQISGSGAGGIFGSNAAVNSGSATATNCYTSGAGNIVRGIFGSNPGSTTATNCYSEANNGSSGWKTTNTTNILQNIDTTPITNPIWLNVKSDSPFLLYGTSSHYYNTNFYTTSSATITPNSYTNLNLVTTIAGNFFYIIPINNVTINSSSGQMTSSVKGDYTVYVISGNLTGSTIYGYNTIVFNLSVNSTTINASGIIYIQQNINDIFYDSEPSFLNPTKITWNDTSTGGCGVSTSTTLIVKLTTPINIQNVSNVSPQSIFFVCNTPYITFDGNYNNTDCIVYVDNKSTLVVYAGFIQNGNNNGNAQSNIVVQNIKIVSVNNNSTLFYGTNNNGGGWICQSYFGNGNNSCFVQYCSSNAPIKTNNQGGGGGILGYKCSANVLNCYSTGDISGLYSGGIFGNYAGNSGSASVANCYSMGEISGYYAGGIFGSSAGQSGLATVTNCYSIGEISGYYAGGIFGSYAGTSGSAISDSSYSVGLISGTSAGGIFAPTTGTTLQSNCYSCGSFDIIPPSLT